VTKVISFCRLKDPADELLEFGGKDFNDQLSKDRQDQNTAKFKKGRVVTHAFGRAEGVKTFSYFTASTGMSTFHKSD
jgi:hypothetical protein